MRLIVGGLADLIRESQRAPSLAAGALLLTLTVTIAATSFPAAEPVLVAAMLAIMHLAEALPFVDMAPYFTADEAGGRFTLSGTEEAGGFLNDALLPFYAYLTGVLILIRWLLRLKPGAPGFWVRFRPIIFLCAICLAGFILSAFMRDDVAEMSPLFLALVVVTLLTGSWASIIGSAVDGLVSKLSTDRATGNNGEP